MLHELEGPLDHCVLKVPGGIKSRNLAGKVLTDAKVFGLPPHRFAQTDESGRDSADRPLTRLFGAQQMYFDAAGKVKASLNGRGDLHALFNGNHKSTVFSLKSGGA
jgi:hypothetical protein